jgi:hypothetical protein
MVGKSLSHYKIVSELGRGGMGIVYKSEDLRLDREVALTTDYVRARPVSHFSRQKYRENQAN